MQIKSDSMAMAVLKSEYILIETNKYIKNNLKRGDVVVFKHPITNLRYIKRIVGLPNETIRWVAGKVFIDGKELQEPYKTESYKGPLLPTSKANEKILAPDTYFVLGDQRDNSMDSRHFGSIHKKQLVGKAKFIWLSINRDGLVRKRRMLKKVR